MKKHILAIGMILIALLASCSAPAAEPGLEETAGRLLLSAEGTAILVTEDGTPIVLSVQTEGDTPWDDFHSGDKITVTHDGVNDSYPAQTGAYRWERLEEGALSDIPEETLQTLEELGWNFDAHAPARTPQTVEDPVAGYCGLTETKVTLAGEEYSFWGGDSVELTNIVENLAYEPKICRCMPEFTVTTEFGEDYGVNLTDYYVRCEKGQAPLTEEQAELIQGIIDRNCNKDSQTEEASFRIQECFSLT